MQFYVYYPALTSPNIQRIHMYFAKFAPLNFEIVDGSTDPQPHHLHASLDHLLIITTSPM